jgi:signal transduction histidine kinase
MLAGNVRRNLFLVIKESLNNIIKHAGATEVNISIQLTPELEIQITDNGKGIDDIQKDRFGNGLKNMGRRMQSIGGSYQITSAATTTGTTTTLRVSLDA